MKRDIRFNRKSPRLLDFDYAQPGAYFVTACVRDRKCVLGRVTGETVILSMEGEIVQAVWGALPDHFNHIELDEFVVMPNHIHGIIWIKETSKSDAGARHASPTKRSIVGAQHAAPLQQKKVSKPLPGSLGAIVRSFKSAVTGRINQLHKIPGAKFWQRSFYEHVLRNDEDLFNHRQYICDNPLKWTLDEYYRESHYA